MQQDSEHTLSDIKYKEFYKKRDTWSIILCKICESYNKNSNFENRDISIF